MAQVYIEAGAGAANEVSSTALQTAANAVFNTYELAAIILSSLDELSLVRVQMVNRTCRNLVKETKSLQERLFLQHERKNDICTTNSSEEPRFRWNPLLDWFATQMCLAHQIPGLVGRKGNGPIFNFLPHAIRAGKEPASSVHSMLITKPPSAHLILWIPYPRIYANLESKAHFVRIRREEGVTLGDILRVWSGSTSLTGMAFPVCLWKPKWAVAYPQILPQLQDEYETLTRAAYKIGYSDPPSKQEVVLPNTPWYNIGLNDGVLQDWAKMVFQNGEQWFLKTTKLEQNRYMRAILDMQQEVEQARAREIYPRSNKGSDLDQSPSYDKKLRGTMARYPKGTNYAAGLVYNMQD